MLIFTEAIVALPFAVTVLVVNVLLSEVSKLAPLFLAQVLRLNEYSVFGFNPSIKNV